MNSSKDYGRLFCAGELYDAYNFLGCRLNDDSSATFRVWAPNAKSISVFGDFNGWDENAFFMQYEEGGIWSATIPNVKQFDSYKYVITTHDGRTLYKADPYAFHGETCGGTNSKVFDLKQIKIDDAAWQKKRMNADVYRQPVNIYEAHIGSWRRYEDGNCFDYRKFADEIVPYLVEMNYTHIELMGIAEYPFDGSWGYQVTGYFAPTSRYGSPLDFAYLVESLHKAGIGIILDWVPGHFPKDAHGLYEFDGSPLYEPCDPLMKEHKEWGTHCFDYDRNEVRSFLISNANYWFDVFHIDGLRVDAVASMLYLDYNRKEWRPNRYGGNENIGAIEFFKQLNSVVFCLHKGIMMIAEESTAWPLVTKPVSDGGLGFNFKWNMGWMNDTLSYAKTDPFFRAGCHNNLTFSMTYAFSENYILPISHDEVVHGKGSLINKMPGSYEQKFAGWRNYLMSMFAQPGKKLTFMGCEFAQFSEWAFHKELDWLLFEYETHRQAKTFFKELSKCYKENSQFYEIEDDWSGFEWLVADDNTQNIIVYERRNKKGERIICVFNFSPIEHKGYRFGADEGTFKTILYSDIDGFSTSGKTYKTTNIASHNKKSSLSFDIAPMSGAYIKEERKNGKSDKKAKSKK